MIIQILMWMVRGIVGAILDVMVNAIAVEDLVIIHIYVYMICLLISRSTLCHDHLALQTMQIQQRFILQQVLLLILFILPITPALIPPFMFMLPHFLLSLLLPDPLTHHLLKMILSPAFCYVFSFTD
jgi:hypothetical protein